MSDLPRLLLCSFDVIPGPSGSSRRMTEYLKALPDRFAVVVLSAKTPDHSHIEKYQGARLLRVPVGSGDLASRIQAFERAVKRQLDSEDYALAHFTDPFGGYVLCEMKGDYGYRLVYEAQTFPSQELRYTHPQIGGDKRFLAKIRRQELFCLMNADLVITGSQTTRSYIQTLGAATEQTRVMRAPVDLVPYTPDVLGVPDGQPMRLMYLGSQAGWQGLPTLLRALALALEQGAEVKLCLVGARHPDWQPHLEELAKELRLQEHVEFQQPVPHDDLVKVLALADVGVLPLEDVERNRLQGGPLAKAAEYLAAGRPVLAADLPVTRELLPSSATVFHPPGDAKALADCIAKLARDVPRRLELGREARVFAEQELDAGLIRGKLLDIYDELLGKRAPVATLSEENFVPTMTGTPTNRLSNLKPPEGGRRSSRGKRASSAQGKQSSKEPGREELPPLVVGQALLEEGLDTRLIKTEPDARPADPPVVMGLPLRDQKPLPPEPLRRDDPDEPPTSIIQAGPPATREPPAHSPAPPREEDPPAPTPIVPMKALGAGRTTGASRSETGTSRPPMPPSRSTGSRKAFQDSPATHPPASTRSAPPESARGQEPSEKGKQPALPPVVRAGPTAAESKGPPPRLLPVDAPPPLKAAEAPPARKAVEVPPAPKAAWIPPTRKAAEEEPEELSEEEAEEIPDEAALSAAPTPPYPRPRVEEPEEISSDEIEEADAAGAREAPDDQVEDVGDAVEPVDDDIEPVDDDLGEAEPADDAIEPVDEDDEAEEAGSGELEEADAPAVEAVDEDRGSPVPEPPGSALDPWFAQLAHGYCPPEGAQFARHTPPTNFPGRDEEPTDPSRAPPSSKAESASRGNRS